MILVPSFGLLTGDIYFGINKILKYVSCLDALSSQDLYTRQKYIK